MNAVAKPEFELVATFPAYRVVKRVKRGFHDRGMMRIHAGEKLGLKRSYAGGDYYQQFTAGSVVSYALENGQCPVHAIDDARSKDHKLHWLNASSTMLTAEPRPQEQLIEIAVDQVVCFEGSLFKIRPAPNQNLELVPFQFAGC